MCVTFFMFFVDFLKFLITHEFNLGDGNGCCGDWCGGVSDVVVSQVGVSQVGVSQVGVSQVVVSQVSVSQVVVGQVVVSISWGGGSVSWGSGGVSVLVVGDGGSNGGSGVGNDLSGGSDEFLVNVGLSGDLFVNVSLSGDLFVNVGLSSDLLVNVGLSSDFLMDVGLSNGLFVDVGLGNGVDLSGVVVGVDGEDLLGSVADWGSGGGVSEGLGGVVQCVGCGGVLGSGVSQGLGSVVQGIGGSSQDGGWGGGDGQKARKNCNLKDEKKS